ncbi:hypothetical protein ACFQ1E_07145 [Sphingomonas canadensis]|uniref:Uncharacterized protein n=1 Tax=Sphingomonas canadensis TaxID=1219257 RepID=A0ABW3H5Z9_9SPHN|nr:hypothetical protein [Sphingomonas canadensis]MCW3835440.1 hypothetical protein [Sphingomonas canadensis]
MKPIAALAAAAALFAVPAAQAAPLCKTLKAVLPVAKKDKWMAALKTGEPVNGEWMAKEQIDGFKCVITTGSTPGMTRGFFNCTWAGNRTGQPVTVTVAEIARCLGKEGTVEKKTYTTTTLWDVRAKPRILIALNEFSDRLTKFSFSVIAE